MQYTWLNTSLHIDSAPCLVLCANVWVLLFWGGFNVWVFVLGFIFGLWMSCHSNTVIFIGSLIIIAILNSVIAHCRFSLIFLVQPYCKQTQNYWHGVCWFFHITFFPPCFSTMSVLSGKWSSWGFLEPPPLGIVQLSPRQASFTLPLHRHRPSGTGGRNRVGEVSIWHAIFNHCTSVEEEQKGAEICLSLFRQAKPKLVQFKYLQLFLEI